MPRGDGRGGDFPFGTETPGARGARARGGGEGCVYPLMLSERSLYISSLSLTGSPDPGGTKLPPDRPSLQDWIHELERRNVFRVAAVYAGVGFVLVQATAYLFEALLFPPWAHRLFVVFVLLGFPVALVLAWAFELTPEGVRPSGELPGGEGAAPGGRDGSWAATAVALMVLVGGAMAAGGWAAWDAWLAPEIAESSSARASSSAGSDSASAELPATRLAVLYLDDHSEGGELEHVAAGLTESLIHEFNRVPGLDVVSRNGVMPYRDPDIPLDSIARVLGAGSLVEGSVERVGDSLRVTVQLVDGETASHLMSRRFRGEVDAPLSVRRELVGRVAGLLRRELGQQIRLEEARAGTDHPRAWELYHLAREIERDADSLRAASEWEGARSLFLEADSILEQAGRLDPDWRAPTLERTHVAQSLARLGHPEVSRADPGWLERGIEQADRVLSEVPDHAEALARRGELRYLLAETRTGAAAERTAESAAEDLRRAVSETPGLAEAWSRLYWIRYNDARFAEARSAMRRAREADRFLFSERQYDFQRAALALDMEEFERAERLLRQALEKYPDSPAFLYKQLQFVACTASSHDRIGTAWDLLERTEAARGGGPWPAARALVAAVAARVGMRDSARAILRRLEPGQDPGDSYRRNTAYAHLLLEDEAETLDLLARHLEANPGKRDYIAAEWWWRPLRDHPRFQELVAGAG